MIIFDNFDNNNRHWKLINTADSIHNDNNLNYYNRQKIGKKNSKYNTITEIYNCDLIMSI